jgi:hypothetical protein
MNKKLPIILPIIAVLVVLFIFLFDLHSPFIWFIAVLVGVDLLCRRADKCHLKDTRKLLWASWILALISILGFYSGWPTQGWDVLIWILPIAGFTLMGIILLFVEAIRKSKK